MGIVPVLVVILIVASVVSNYKKIAAQRLEDQKRRIQMMKNTSNQSKTQENDFLQIERPLADATNTEPIFKTAAPSLQRARPNVSVKNMQNAVIMAEILNKPVSLREK